jgi:hypothetical protein
MKGTEKYLLTIRSGDGESDQVVMCYQHLKKYNDEGTKIRAEDLMLADWDCKCEFCDKT